MHRLFLYNLVLLVVLFSCKNPQDGTDKKAEIESLEITEKDVNNIDYLEFALDEKTENTVEDWVEYYQLQNVINNVKKGDLSFFENNEGFIDSTLTAFKKNIPEQINSPSISARINAFETKFLKLESFSNLTNVSKKELLSNVEDLLVAFSNFNLQMNKEVEFDSQNIEKP
ncbi:hypothetical protein N1F78_05165 [Seonamhaeicola sp. MEBiC1930]|uniref:hypothetical protein n=1 Tax=Seonamhaeicola sp. MEBiC01930 TaxID=2976768 RepID=UPI003244BA7D